MKSLNTKVLQWLLYSELLKQFAIFTTLHIDHKAKTTKRFCGSNRVKTKFLGFHYVLRFKDSGLIKFIPKFDR